MSFIRGGIEPLKMLTDRRDVLVAQRTSSINRLRWNAHELDPERGPAPRALNATKHQQALQAWPQNVPCVVAELARAKLGDVIRLNSAPWSYG
jgi:transposase